MNTKFGKSNQSVKSVFTGLENILVNILIMPGKFLVVINVL